MPATGRIRRGEPEIIWKQGAENDLLQIFAELEERCVKRPSFRGQLPKSRKIPSI